MKPHLKQTNPLKRLWPILGLVFCVVTLWSCGAVRGSDSEFEYLQGMNISDANRLFIADRKLYKITGSDNAQEVQYHNKNGEIFTEDRKNAEPIYMENINDRYVAIIFGWPQISAFYNEHVTYLVDKNTGNAYMLGIPSTKDDFVQPETVSTFINYPVFALQGDSLFYNSNGLFYAGTGYIKITKRVSKTDISKIEQMVVQNYYGYEETLTSFAVDSAGNVIMGLQTTSGDGFCKAKNYNGGLTNAEIYDTGFVNIHTWKAADGKLYCYNSTTDALYQMDIAGKLLTATETGSAAGFNTNTSFIFNFGDSKTLVIDISSKKVTEVYNKATGTILTTDITGFKSMSTVVAGDNFYYIAGVDNDDKEIVSKCSITNHACTPMVTEFGKGEYIINTMEYSSGSIVFSAVSKSHGGNIIGIADPGFPADTLDSQINKPATRIITIR